MALNCRRGLDLNFNADQICAFVDESYHEYRGSNTYSRLRRPLFTPLLDSSPDKMLAFSMVVGLLGSVFQDLSNTAVIPLVLDSVLRYRGAG